jgi:hypothetical protein
MNFKEHNSEIAILTEELEALATRIEELRAKERKERALKGEIVFVRPAKIRALIYERFQLYNHFEAKAFAKGFASTTKKLDNYVNAVALRVCECFKRYGCHRKPLPKEIVERVVDYYIEALKTSRRVYVITKEFAKRKRKIKTPTLQTQLPSSRPSAREGLGHEGQGREAEQGLGQTEAREGE